MAIGLVGTSTGTTGSANSTTAGIAYPAGIAAGNAILIWCASSNNSCSWSAPGYIAITVTHGSTVGSCQLLSKVAAGTETGTLTVTNTISTGWDAAMVVDYGTNPSMPFDPTPLLSGQVNASSTSAAAASITTTNFGDRLIWFGFSRAASGGVPPVITAPSLFAARITQVNTTSSSGANTGILVADASQALPGATGTVTGSLGSGSINGGLLVALQPAPSPPATAAFQAQGTLTANATVTAGNVPASMQAHGTLTAIAGIGNSDRPATLSMHAKGTLKLGAQITTNDVLVGVLNQWTNDTTQFTYDTLQVEVANTEGNWLFAVCSWEPSQEQAVIYAVDDGHNFWQPLIASPPIGGQRLAILYTANARAAELVSISSSTWVENLCVDIIEVTGLSAGVIIDAQTSFNDGCEDTFTMSLPATPGDFVLGVVCTTPSIGLTMTGGLTAQLSPVSNGPQLQNGGWAATSGAVTATWTAPEELTWAGAMVAIRVSAPLPVASNPAWPVIKCYAAFGYPVGTPTQNPVWTDITDRYLGISGQRGRQYELDQLAAADYTITLRNDDGALNPVNQLSPFFPNVQCMTPIQVLATWQGRTYPVFTGFVLYWPQTYDFQYGIIQAQCSDSFAKMPQALINNCVISEILIDNPWAYWTLGDPAGTGGTSGASNWSGRSQDFLAEVGSKYNGPAGSGSVAFGATVDTATPLAGDDETCWQTSGNKSSLEGWCLQDIDNAMPSITNGLTIECWANLSKTQPNDDTTEQVGLIILKNLQDVQGVGGSIIQLGANYGAGDAAISTWDSSLAFNETVTTHDITDGNWHHHVLVLTPAGWSYYLDGSKVDSKTVDFFSLNPNLASFCGQADALFTGRMGNMSLAHIAIYDQALSTFRIQAHFNSGSTGFAGELTGARISRMLRYGGWAAGQAVDPGEAEMQALNYLTSGYGAYGISGSVGLYANSGGQTAGGAQLDASIEDVAASEGGMMFTDIGGNFIYKSRANRFNVPVTAAFGDSTVPLNQVTGFDNGVGSWVPHGGALATSSNWFYSGGSSLQLTPNGTTLTPYASSEHVSITAGNEYTASAWVYLPLGFPGGTTAAIAWFDNTGTLISTSNSFQFIPPGTPLQVSTTATAPSNAVTATIRISMNGTPPSSVVLYADRAILSAAGPQLSYQEDIELDYDITYVYNNISVQRNSDGALLRVQNQLSESQYYQRVYTATLFTQPTEPPDDVTDMANWLLSSYSQPKLRCANMTIDAASNPDAWPLVLGLEIGDAVSFTRSALGQPQFSAIFQIVSVQPSMGQDQASFAYILAPVQAPVLTLGDPTYGILGPNALGF